MYTALILAVIGGTDTDMAALVEHLMRIANPTLDGLEIRQFRKAARQALLAAQILHREGELVLECQAYRLTVPACYKVTT